MDQNSNNWLDWRDNTIGSSEAGTIMGASPYNTPYELWLQRTGRVEVDQEKYAYMLGHKFEPILRELAESRVYEVFEPQNINSSNHRFMHASVDGINMEGNIIMEIKLNKADVHKMVAAKGIVPEYHLWQIQHQLIVTGATFCYYVSGPFKDDPNDITAEELNIIKVLPRQPMIDELLAAEGAFIENLATDTPPELVARDGVRIKSASWKRNASEYLQLEKKIKALKKKRDRCKARMKEMSGTHQIARGYGVCVKNTVQKGRVSYGQVPELKGVNLDKYRGASIIKTTFGADR